MIKNFAVPKTGDEVLDEHFRNTPLWYDTDMLKMYVIGILTGALMTVLLIFTF
jgi:hypothetical protein